MSTIAPRSCDAIACDFGGVLVADVDRPPAQDSGGRGRPRIRIGNQRHVAGSRHLHRDLLQRPAAAELERLEPRVGEPPLGEALARPARRLHVRRGAGQARADRVAEREIQLLRPRTLKPLLPDAGGHLEVDGFLRWNRRDAENGDQRSSEKPTHAGLLF